MSVMRGSVTPHAETRKRIALFSHSLGVEGAVETECITYEKLLAHSDARHIKASRMTVSELKESGCASAHDVKCLGFDALHLTDPAFCHSMVGAFGAEAVCQAFLSTPGDAVAVAGVTAPSLNLSVEDLLCMCVGAPEEAKAVVQQSEPKRGALVGVSISTLLDCGLRAPTLSDIGYLANDVSSQMGATISQIKKLGF